MNLLTWENMLPIQQFLPDILEFLLMDRLFPEEIVEGEDANQFSFPM